MKEEKKLFIGGVIAICLCLLIGPLLAVSLAKPEDSELTIMVREDHANLKLLAERTDWMKKWLQSATQSNTGQAR